MHIYLGYDHAGKVLKESVMQSIDALGATVVDLGSTGDMHDDYPDFALVVAEKVSEDPSAKGILICGTGAGMAIAANKVSGIRAATADTEETARLIRAHNDANILALAGRIIAPELAQKIITTFLTTDFAGGRHQRRVNKIIAIEQHIPLANS
jgi:ribose 5-phosphate isomerase B